MKVHPMPKRRNISIQYEAQALLNHHKKLRRLPHVFSRVLELPFRSDAEVLIEEKLDCFRFVAETESSFGVDVRTHTVEIHPGVTKIVVRERGSAAELTLDELELDMWRFRLPETTRPELARAVFVDGELIVTVPKIEGTENAEDRDGGEVWGGGDGNGGFRRGLNSQEQVWSPGASPSTSPAEAVPQPTPSAESPESDTTPSSKGGSGAPTATTGSRLDLTLSAAMPSYSLSPSLLLFASAVLVLLG